ncbi:hypothetical protein HY948_02845 [Candidatus Gottesmanbacteria bacterium]|nr:hypothetical protein [Candidatus Gottesmanbacteria bacterium]
MPDDILDAAQKQINDAANQLPVVQAIDSLPPADPVPALPVTLSSTTPSQDPMSPIPVNPVAPPITPAEPTPSESALVDTIIHESETPTVTSSDLVSATDVPLSATPPEPPTMPVVPPAPKKKSGGKGFITAILFLLLLTVPIAVYYISMPKQLADIRNRAALDCGGYPPITCSNGSQACLISQCPVSGGGCGAGSASCCEGKSPGTVTCGGAVGSCFINGQIDGHDVCGFQFASVCPGGACVREGSGGGPTYWPGRKCKDDGSGYIEGDAGKCNAGNPNDTTCGCVYGDNPGDIGPMTCRTKTVPPVITSENPSVANCKSGSGPTPTPTSGTSSTPTPTPGGGGGGPTPTPGGGSAQCTRIRVYKNNAQVDPTTLLPGDAVVLAVAGSNATKGRIRVNGAAWTESTTLNSNGEYTVAFTIPTGITSFTAEAEVHKDGVWQ